MPLPNMYEAEGAFYVLSVPNFSDTIPAYPKDPKGRGAAHFGNFELIHFLKFYTGVRTVFRIIFAKVLK